MHSRIEQGGVYNNYVSNIYRNPQNLYTSCVYLKYILIVTMKDLAETSIVCKKCKEETTLGYTTRDGVKIRIWQCPKCHETWYHPGDMEEYKQFLDLKKREFEVKLRQVGNSWAVSIPKEIIRFESVEHTKVIRMSLDEPGKIVLSFKKMRKVY